MDNLLLGKSVAYDAPYDPNILCPIARAPGRQQLGVPSPLPFFGCDIWNAYELSWLDRTGKPVVACGEFRIPADSLNIVESKSFKLYLNSLNQHRFDDVAQLIAVLRRDLAACLGATPEIAIHLPAQWSTLRCVEPEGLCLDDLPVQIEHYHPAPHLLNVGSAFVKQKVFSRLLRSCCPVTGQPDWATLHIEYSGQEIESTGLLAYIVSFRLHQDFHEHCVERIFHDIMQRCAPEQLSVYARYLRRGGLDINPFRGTGHRIPDNSRFWQQ